VQSIAQLAQLLGQSLALNGAVRHLPLELCLLDRRLGERRLGRPRRDLEAPSDPLAAVAADVDRRPSLSSSPVSMTVPASAVQRRQAPSFGACSSNCQGWASVALTGSVSR
jgi:hypothetical protein